MRTVTMLFVITSLLLCGFIAAAQEEAAPGTSTAPAVGGAPGQETVEGAPGAETAPVDGPREGDRLPDGTLVGTPRGERPVKQEDLDQGDGNVNPPNPPAQPTERVVERRTVVVRQLAAATQRGDQVAVKRLTTELGKLNERLALVETNPLGGEEGQRSMWDILHSAGVKSESYLVQHYVLEPREPAEGTSPASAPAAPQGQKEGNTMPLALQIILGAVGAAGVVLGIVALTRGGNLAVLAGALGDAADRAQNNERLTFSAGPGRMRLTVEPANATPILPPAPAPAPQQPAFPQAPLGVAYVAVPVTANPVVLNPAQPAPAAPVPAAPAPQAQPVQVWFNNNLQGAAPPRAQPQARQPQAPQGQQPRQPRNQPRNQGPANPPAAGQGAPPAQGGGQGGNVPANP